MSELVLLHHNEPMTTSLAIADGTENTHKAVIQLVRKYVDDLQEFGRVAFEMRPFDTEGGNQWREIAFLNEPQSTLLITYLRNSDTVRRFKIALVKAFYEMRDRLRGDPAPQFVTSNLAHGADLAVAADRTFRSFMRAARSAGVALPKALRIANAQTLRRTGMDMLAELGVEPPPDAAPSLLSVPGVERFGAAWLAGELPVPVCICRNADLYAAYQRWCAANGITPVRDVAFHPALRRAGLGVRQSHVAVSGNYRVRATIPPGGEAGAVDGEKGRFYAASIASFADALKDWL